MLDLTSGGVMVENNCFIHVCEKFKENRYVQAVDLKTALCSKVLSVY